MMKEKMQSKEAEKRKEAPEDDLEDSSLYEDPPEPAEKPKDILKPASGNENVDKENDKQSSPVKKPKEAVSRTYSRKQHPNTSKKAISFNQTSKPKENKKEKKLNEWSKLQNSHFEDVDDFDLSFG